MLSVVAPDYGFHDKPPNQHFPEMLTKTFSVFSHPTTLAKSPKLAAQTFRTWKRGSTQSAANLSRNTDSVISFPISGAILLKSWTNAKCFCFFNRICQNLLWTFQKLITNFTKNSYELLKTSYALRKNFLRTSQKLLTNFAKSSYKLCKNFLQTSQKLLMNFAKISYELHKNILWALQKLLTNFIKPSYKLHKNFLYISCFYINFLQVLINLMKLLITS